MAEKLAAPSAASAEAVREVAAKLHRYFTVSFSLHEEDEELSLYPRLLKAVPELAPTLQALRAEHQAQAQRVEEMVEVCRQALHGPDRAAAFAAPLAYAAQALKQAFQTHLDTEERDVFPRVQDSLPEAALAEIREEMRARRARLPK